MQTRVAEIRARLAARMGRPTPPPIALGAAIAFFLVIETLLVYSLTGVVPAGTLANIFLIGVLAISTMWGLPLALGVVVLGTVAYGVDMKDSARVAAFFLVAMLASLVVQLARTRAAEAVTRRQEADLLAELARLMLCADDLRSILPEASRRLARTLGLSLVAIELDSVPGDAQRLALPLRYCSHTGTGTLLVSAGSPEPVLRRLRERVVAPLETLLGAAANRGTMSESLRANRDELSDLAREQASLRRVAVLVAHGAPPSDAVAAVAAETASLLESDATRLVRHEPAGTVSVVAEYSELAVEPTLGRQLLPNGGVTELVLRTARPARVDSYDGREGALADLARHQGFKSSVGAPIVVEGRVWGALVALWARRGPVSPGAPDRLAQFTELVATAVANAESRDELKASRARIVLAADEARRRFERDVHDGVQQRLVSLGLELRMAEALVPPELVDVKARLCATTEGLTDVFNGVREISRGLHPAILSKGGLMSALRAVARRCPVPVTITPGSKYRLPNCVERVEVAAYYLVSEALTNVVRHAQASAVDINVEFTRARATGREFLVVSVHDDGVGGANSALGTGLVGLADRVAALGGRLRIVSPAGEGTTLKATLPTDAECCGEKLPLTDVIQ
ncbi:sensor histidine kinase [Dactylosporangium darangshiense]|uniref:histidine kinase n=1 Tax=Dactylosporangium darangshiense TaxID=579108 RepID=A0ABP8DWD4_9ACTN